MKKVERQISFDEQDFRPDADLGYQNDTLYPEGSVINASNYCRNPSKNIAGTWCYTLDSAAPRDLCNVKDCDVPGGKFLFLFLFRFGQL